jgi:hypothetical protein
MSKIDRIAKKSNEKSTWKVTLLDTFNRRTQIAMVQADNEDEAAALAVARFPKFKFVRAECKLPKTALDEVNRAINDAGAEPDPRTDKEYDHPWDQKGTEPWTPGQGTELGNVKISDNVETFAPGAKRKLRDFERMPERFKEIKNFNRKRKERPAAPRTSSDIYKQEDHWTTPGFDMKIDCKHCGIKRPMSEVPGVLKRHTVLLHPEKLKKQASQDTSEIIEAGWKKIVNALEYSRYEHPNLPGLVLEVTKWGFTLFTQDTEKGYVPLESGDLSGLDGFLMGLSGTGKFAKEALFGKDKVNPTKPNRPKKYPDTAAGAIAFLKDESTLDLKGAKGKADPSVAGVWQITTNSGQRTIVYLAGYKDPFGKLRSYNDFETEDEPELLEMGDLVRIKNWDDTQHEIGFVREGNVKLQDPETHQRYTEGYESKWIPMASLELISKADKTSAAKGDRKLRPGEYEEPQPLRPKWKQDEEDAYQQEEQEKADNDNKTSAISEADDMCNACGKRVANRECAHGILCDVCDKQVHGKKGGPCKIGSTKIATKWDSLAPHGRRGWLRIAGDKQFPSDQKRWIELDSKERTLILATLREITAPDYNHKEARMVISDDVSDTLHKAVRILGQNGIPSLVVGGLAVAELGYPRYTTDADIVVPDPKKAEEVLLNNGFVPSKKPLSVMIPEIEKDVDLIGAGEKMNVSKVPHPTPTEVVTVPKFCDLKTLIDLKLGSYVAAKSTARNNRNHDRIDVEYLIENNQLPREFMAGSINQQNYEILWDMLHKNNTTKLSSKEIAVRQDAFYAHPEKLFAPDEFDTFLRTSGQLDRTAEIKMHETPKFLPPRDDMRRHLDEDLKKELHEDDDVKTALVAGLKTARPEMRKAIEEMAVCPKCRACVNNAAIVRLVNHLKKEHGLGDFAQTVSEEVFKLVSDLKQQPVTSSLKVGDIKDEMVDFADAIEQPKTIIEKSDPSVHPDSPSYRYQTIKKKPEDKKAPVKTPVKAPSTKYEYDPSMVEQIERFGGKRIGSMKIAEFADLWNNATPRGRCKLLGMDGKPTTILFFKPWEELDERERGLLANWLRIQKLQPNKSATETNAYWLDQLAEAEEDAKATFMQDPNMIDVARMEGVNMETLWQQEKKQYLNLIYDPKP